MPFFPNLRHPFLLQGHIDILLYFPLKVLWFCLSQLDHLIHLEFIFVYGMSYSSNFLHEYNQCFQHHLLLIQNSTLSYNTWNIHIGTGMLVGSLLCRVFNLSMFIPITHSLSYHCFRLNLDIWSGESLLQIFLGCFLSFTIPGKC